MRSIKNQRHIIYVKQILNINTVYTVIPICTDNNWYAFYYKMKKNNIKSKLFTVAYVH